MGLMDILANRSGLPAIGSDTPQQHGFAGWLDRFVNPQNTLGQLGRALVVAGGTPIGTAFQYMDQQRRTNAQTALENQLHQAELEHTRAETAHLSAGPEPDEFDRTLIAGGMTPGTPEWSAAHASRARNMYDPILPQVVHDEDPRTHTITDRVIGVPTSSLRGGGQPSPMPGALAVPASEASPTPAAPTQPATNSYNDPAYSALEAQMEQKYGLPPGLMASIRTSGEQSNADQVSSAGAKTVYQVTPPTRQLFLNKYGIDAYAGAPQAAEVAALHLRDSIARGEDPVRGYIGGPDRSKWGRQTAAYGQRVHGDLLAQASDAIARGADPVKVHARLKEMGVE
jgi:hypothetical protein